MRLENSQIGVQKTIPTPQDRSWSILTRSFFRDFGEDEFFRSL
jgi:hypothetical protein